MAIDPNLKELGKQIFEVSHLTGEFKLRSGKISNEYFDKYRFEAQPELLATIAKALAPSIPEDTEVLAGLEMGGIPIATALSLETGLPAAFVRKKAKDYGTRQFAEGIEVNGKKLCLIEDVITTGGQVVQSSLDLRSSGAKVEHVLCVIYRGDGEPEKLHAADLSLRSLFTKEDLHEASR